MEWLIKRFIFFLIFKAKRCSAREAPASQSILDYAQHHLSEKGTLQSSEGFVYVKVDDAYVHQLVAFIADAGFEKPPYFGKEGLVGAHITVISPEEVEKYRIGPIAECGETVFFELKGCRVVHPPKWEEGDEAYFLVVEAPALEQLREKYGLPKGPFAPHITIGIKRKLPCSA